MFASKKCRYNTRVRMLVLDQLSFFVEGKVIVEIKAIEKLEDVHKVLPISYREAYNIADGWLINFGGKSLDFKLIYTKNRVNSIIK